MEVSYRQEKQRLRSIRWMLFWIVAVQSGVSMIISIVSSFFEESTPYWIPLLLVELLAYLLPLSMYARENRILTARTAREGFGLKPCRKDLWAYVIPAGIGCQFLMVILNLPLSLLLQEDSMVLESFPELLTSLVVVALVPAIFEEFLFRGIVYGVMKEFNSKGAMIFTTLLFALMHGSLAGILGYLFLGWATVQVLRRTGSLYACMGFHLANNVTAVLLSRYSANLMSYPAGTLWLFGSGLLAAVLGVWGLWKAGLPHKATKRMKTRELLGQSFLSFPILLCLLCIAGVWIFG